MIHLASVSDAHPLPEHDHFLDTSGLVCPLPVLKARKRILSLNSHETLLIQMTDPDAPDDLKALCRKLHAEVLSLIEIKKPEVHWLMLVGISNKNY